MRVLRTLPNEDPIPSTEQYNVYGPTVDEFHYWNPELVRATERLYEGNSSTHQQVASPYLLDGSSGPYSSGGHFFNLPSGDFAIEQIGTVDRNGQPNGCSFVDTIPSSYPLAMHVLDNFYTDPAKGVQRLEVAGNLPSGWSYAEEWRELIYDGTPMGATSFDLVLRAHAAVGVRERAFTVNVLQPVAVYGPGGDFDPTLGAGHSMRKYLEAIDNDQGKPVVAAFLPQVIDMAHQVELLEAEGTTATFMNVWPIGNRSYSDVHQICYGGSAEDRVVKHEAIHPFDGREGGGNWTGPFNGAADRRNHRAVFYGLDVNCMDISSNRYRGIVIQNCDVHDNVGTTGIRVGVGVGYRDCPTHLTIRDVKVWNCGAGNTEHNLYLHGGDRGRINIDNLDTRAARRSICLKAYVDELYIRNSFIASYHDVTQAENWQQFDATTSDQSWHEWSNVLLDIGAGAANTVIANNVFEHVRFEAPDGTNVGNHFCVLMQARREWSSCPQPPYGSERYMDPAFWEEVASIGLTNPENPHTKKVWFSGNTIRRYRPQNASLRNLPTTGVGNQGTFPYTQDPPGAYFTSKSTVLAVPDNWQERAVVAWADDNVMTEFDTDFELRTGRDGVRPGPRSTFDESKWPIGSWPETSMISATGDESWFQK